MQNSKKALNELKDKDANKSKSAQPMFVRTAPESVEPPGHQ